MPTPTPNASVAELLQQGLLTAEEFQAESLALDQAWRAGQLEQWTAERLQHLRESSHE